MRKNFGISVQVAVLSTAISLVLAITGGLWYRNGHPARARAWFDAMTYSRIVLPEVVFALGLFLLFSELNIGLGVGAIVVGHVVFNSAYATIIMQARFSTMSTTLEEAAADLGAQPLAGVPPRHAAAAHARRRRLRAAVPDVLARRRHHVAVPGRDERADPARCSSSARSACTSPPRSTPSATGLMLITLLTFLIAGLITLLRPTGAGGMLGLGRKAAE